MTERPRDVLVRIEKSLQSMNDLDIQPRSSQLAIKWLLNVSVDIMLHVEQ